MDEKNLSNVQLHGTFFSLNQEDKTAGVIAKVLSIKDVFVPRSINYQAILNLSKFQKV